MVDLALINLELVGAVPLLELAEPSLGEALLLAPVWPSLQPGNHTAEPKIIQQPAKPGLDNKQVKFLFCLLLCLAFSLMTTQLSHHLS